MKELYIEGVATHDDPESCAGFRKGTGEALTGAHAGRAIEPRKHQVPGADAVTSCGRPYGSEQNRSLGADPARSKNLSMRRVSRRENREIPRPPEAMTIRAAAGRSRP